MLSMIQTQFSSAKKSRWIIFSLLLFVCMSAFVFQLPAPIQQLVDAERAFAKQSADKSTRSAFLSFLDKEGILFKPSPVNGKAFWESQPEGTDKLTWEPRYADVSAAGDLGYTTGPFEQRANRNDPNPVGTGHYVSVWRKNAQNEWKVVADIGVGHPPSNYTEVKGPSVTAKTTGDWNIISADEVMATELSFVKAQAAQGLSVYNDVLSSETKIFRPGTLPFESSESIQTFIKATDKKFSFTPDRAFIAKSGEMGYVYGKGTVEIIPPGGSVRNLNTAYLRIWKKQEGKKWQIVLDIVTIVR